MQEMDVYAYPPGKLTENEKKLPCARFFTDYPLHKPSPIYQQALDQGPMDPKDAIPAQEWLSLLDIAEKGYRDVMYGYCMMPDGSAFYIEYSTSPVTWQGKWRRWYGNWYNRYSKSTKPEEGNIRYKIWNPIEHWDHRFINGKDDSEGVWSHETLDVGKTGDPSKGIPQISYRMNLREYGLSEEREAELAAKDVRVEGFWEEFPGHPGHHLVLRFSRPCPLGGRESVNCEWLGYYPKDGQILRDESTPCSEEMVKNILIHNTIERQHLYEVLPDLYEAYKDKDLDED
ncbi:MAG: hypothetical protein IJ188_04760 [Clostridia bacterium]|nr:hypothetical protein [Clostridia bacterium]MBQ9251930.1 hypothetical protein [Clostridia bacterium]